MFPLCQPLLKYCQLFQPKSLLIELEGLAGQAVPAEAEIIVPPVSMVSLITQEEKTAENTVGTVR